MRAINYLASSIALIYGAAAAGVVHAQARTFDIPSESLSRALNDFARLSHRQIIFTDEIVRGHVAPALKGTFSDLDALSRLLHGTQLVAHISATGIILIMIDHREKSGPEALPDDNISPEIIVTANKRKERQRDIAGSVSVVARNVIDDTAARQLSDYAPFIQGLSLQSSGAPGRSLVAIRGITTGPNQTGASVATYIDDVPFGSSTAFAEGGRLTPDIDPSQIQQIEVLEGPQGTLYGASSLGGVIKYDLVPANLAITTASVVEELSGGPGESLGYRMQFRVNHPIIRDKLAVNIGGFYRSDSGFTNVIGGAQGSQTNVNRSDIYGFDFAVIFKPSDDLTLKLNALYNRTRSPDGYDDVTIDSTTMEPLFGKYTALIRFPEENYVQYDLYSASLVYQFENFIVTSSTGFSTIHDSLALDYQNYVGVQDRPNFERFGGLENNHTRKFSEEIRIQSRDDEKLEWLLGAFSTSERSSAIQQISGYDDGLRLLPNPFYNIFNQLVGVSYHEFAEFGDINYHLSPKFSITAGIRHSVNHQEFDRDRSGSIVLPDAPLQTLVYPQGQSTDSNFTYLFTGKWQINSEDSLYVRAASGYRPGGPITVPPGSSVPANYPTVFKPDTVWNYELGYRTNFLDGKIRFDATIFYVYWKNIQALIYYSPYYIYGNDGNAISRGVEIKADYKPSSRLNFTGTVGDTDAHMRSIAPTFMAALPGDRLPYVPRWSASMIGNYGMELGHGWRGTLGADLRYQSSRTTDFSLAGDDLTFAGYTIEDARFTVIQKNLQVQVFVDNIANKYAYTAVVNYLPGNPGRPDVSIVQPRTFGIRLTRAF